MGQFLIDDRLGWEESAIGADGIAVRAPRGGLGRWGFMSTPHRGWKYVDVFHVDDDAVKTYWEDRRGVPECEMCTGHALIHVHVLRHEPDLVLHVGHDCAAYLIGDPSLPIGVTDPGDAKIARTMECLPDLLAEGAEWNPATWIIERRVSGRWTKIRRKGFAASIRGFGLDVWAVFKDGEIIGWRGAYWRKNAPWWTHTSKGVFGTAAEARRRTQRAAVIGGKLKPWKGAAALDTYRQALAILP